MPVITADLLVHLSTKLGAAGNSLASTPNASLGKWVATTQIVDATLSNLFDQITGPENAASDVEYRLMFFHNANATVPLQNGSVWIESQVPGGAVAAVSLDTTGISNLGALVAQAKSIADENTAPAGQVFTAPTTRASGLLLPGVLGPGQVLPVWVQRAAQNTGPLALDGVSVRLEGDTSS